MKITKQRQWNPYSMNIRLYGDWDFICKKGEKTISRYKLTNVYKII